MSQKGFILGLVLTIVLVIALAIVGAVFLVIRARQATPASWLYPVKAASNKIELWLTPGREAKAKILLKLADHEAGDIGQLAREKEFEDIIEEAQELRHKLEEVKEQAIDIEATGKSASDLEASVKSVAEKARANLQSASELARGADKGKIIFEMTLLEAFTK